MKMGQVMTPNLDEIQLADRFPQGVRGLRIHAMGAGGHGISAVLRLAAARGAAITGCDMGDSSIARALVAEGIPVAIGHSPAHVQQRGQGQPFDLLLVVPALLYLDPDNAELAEARNLGIPVAEWQAFLGYLMRDAIGVSVAGVHGKGSTSSLLGALAAAGGLDPTVEVGATVNDWGSNLRLGEGQYFINEADEWNYNFLRYHPRMVLLTAVEYDHPEFFPSYEAIRDAFVSFLRGMDTHERADTIPPTLVLNADSPGCLDALAQLGHFPGVVRTFGIERADVDVRGADVEIGPQTSFLLVIRSEPVGRVVLQTPGIHYVANAVAAAAGADALGVAPETIVRALGTFGGLRRRFQIVEDGEVTYIDDYAHHPHAIALTLATARARFPGRRLIGIFQPTLYTRLHRFLTPYSEAFDDAGSVLIVETQPSREHDTGLVHGSDLVRKIAARPAFAEHPGDVRYSGTYEETAALVRELCKPGDVICVMGSGPVNRVIALARS